MGKRSDFERKPRDFYPTPVEAVIPLLPHLPSNTYFDEPCAGNGALINYLESQGHSCTLAKDIEPLENHVERGDAFDTQVCIGHMFITNPPWAWPILSLLITHLSDMAPTWLLLSADLMHNKRMAPYMARCQKVVSVGRVKWIPGSKHTGMENCAWYLFDARCVMPTRFYGREAA